MARCAPSSAAVSPAVWRGWLALGAVLVLTGGGLGAACPDTAVKAGPPPSSAASSTPDPAPHLAPAEAPTSPVAAEAFTAKPAGPRVTVLYTASVQGYVAPCGCTAEPLGGVARLAAAVDEARADHHGQVLFLDAGDLLFERETDDAPADQCQDEARHRLLVSTYARKGLVATTLGPLDDVRGAAWRDALFAQHAVPTVGVNVGRKVTSPSATHLVRKVGDVGVFVTAFRALTADEVEPAIQALARVLDARALGETHVALALAQAPRALARQVVSDPRIRGLDVVILGHRPGETPVAPERIGEGGPVLVASGMQAQHLGVLELELGARAAHGAPAGQPPLALDDRVAAAARRQSLLDVRIKQYEKRLLDEAAGPKRDFIAQKLAAATAERAGLFKAAAAAPPPAPPYVTARSVALVRGFDEEPEAKAGLDAYDASIPTLVRKCEAGIECPPPPAGQPSYVGVETCYACHEAAVQHWRQQKKTQAFTDPSGKASTRVVGHSKAWKTLVDDNKAEDRACVGCHSVGFMAPGGYCKVSEVDFRTDVQCEACHGPGSEHVANAGDKASLTPPTEAVCRGCHHVPHIPTTESFVYEERLLDVLGPGHGEVRWRALKAKAP